MSIGSVRVNYSVGSNSGCDDSETRCVISVSDGAQVQRANMNSEQMTD